MKTKTNLEFYLDSIPMLYPLSKIFLPNIFGESLGVHGPSNIIIHQHKWEEETLHISTEDRLFVKS